MLIKGFVSQCKEGKTTTTGNDNLQLYIMQKRVLSNQTKCSRPQIYWQGKGMWVKWLFVCLFFNQAGLVTSKLMALKLLSVVQQYFLNIQRVPGCELNSAMTQKTSEQSPVT